jgi:addiction module HigA family antidote
MIPKNRRPTHPGNILLTEFLEPMGLSQKDLQEHLGWTYARINEIINGKRGISPKSSLDLADAFGTTPGFWMNLQNHYDLWEALQKHKTIGRMKKAS